MENLLTKHQICREIFKKIYGRYPCNVTYDYKEKNKFDIIRKQTTRSIESFSMIWNGLQTKYNGKFCISPNLAILLIIEVSHRFAQVDRTQNIKRTKILTYINKKKYNKINTQSLCVFFMPFLSAFEVENPEYVKNFKRKLNAVSQIDNNILIFFDSLITQKI